MNTAVIVVLSCLLMASMALAQELHQGDICEKKIASLSSHHCGTLPAQATYTFKNVGPHIVNIRSHATDAYDPYTIGVGESKSYVLGTGTNLYLNRADGEWFSERTLAVQIATIDPCDACAPDTGF
jgi:hypothetical protein